MEPEHLEDALCVREHFFVLFIAGFGFYDFDQFHFIELMHAYHASGTYAGGPGLPAKTRRIRAIINRQLTFLEDLFAMDVRNRGLGGWNEVESAEGVLVQALLYAVILIGKLGE